MNNFEKHAIEEFKAVGWVNADGHYKDDMQEIGRAHV